MKSKQDKSFDQFIIAEKVLSVIKGGSGGTTHTDDWDVQD